MINTLKLLGVERYQSNYTNGKYLPYVESVWLILAFFLFCLCCLLSCDFSPELELTLGLSFLIYRMGAQSYLEALWGMIQSSEGD